MDNTIPPIKPPISVPNIINSSQGIGTNEGYAPCIQIYLPIVPTIIPIRTLQPMILSVLLVLFLNSEGVLLIWSVSVLIRGVALGAGVDGGDVRIVLGTSVLGNISGGGGLVFGVSGMISVA